MVSIEWQPSRKADPRRISFLDLPRELRDQIYDDALKRPGIFSYCPWTRESENSAGLDIRPTDPKEAGFSWDCRVWEFGHPSPAVLRTCRQIHSEAAITLYSNDIELSVLRRDTKESVDQQHTLPFQTYSSLLRSLHAYPLDMICERRRRPGFWYTNMLSQFLWHGLVKLAYIILGQYPNLRTLHFHFKGDPEGSFDSRHEAIEYWNDTLIKVKNKSNEQHAEKIRNEIFGNKLDIRVPRPLKLQFDPVTDSWDESDLYAETGQWNQLTFDMALEQLKDECENAEENTAVLSKFFRTLFDGANRRKAENLPEILLTEYERDLFSAL